MRHLRKVPVTTLHDAFPSIGELDISMHYRYEQRGLPYGEAYALSLITAHVNPRRIFEIGTGVGGATLLMARQAPEAQIDTLDLGVDAASLGEQRGDEPLESEAVGSAYLASPVRERVVQHLGDSARFDYTPFRGQMDLVLVDGAHTREYLEVDSRNALSLIAPGGVIVWDDCHLYHPDVSAGLLELIAQGIPIERIDGTRFALMRSRSLPRVNGESR